MKAKLLSGLFALCLFYNANATPWTVHVTNASCADSCNGYAILMGGIVGNTYHFNWSNGDTLSSSHNLCDGAYWVIVYDSSSSPLDSLNFVITEPGPFVLNPSITDVSCAGNHNGSIVLAWSVGPGDSYVWSNGSSGPYITNLAGGTYSVDAMTSGGCRASGIYTVNEPTPLVVTASVTNTSACGVCDGGVSLTPSGGTAPYDYEWPSIFFGSQPSIGAVCAGSYACTVTDNHNCSVSITNNVSTPTNGLTATLTNTGVYCTGTDTVTVTVSSGVAPYYVGWDEGNNSDWGGPTFTHHYGWPGSRVIYVSDTTGCSFFLTDTIADLSVVASAITLDSTLNCANNQSAVLSAHATGFPPYTYLWSNGSTGNPIHIQVDQDYWVTVTNSFGCNSFAHYDSIYLAPYFLHAYGTSSPCATNGVGNATIVASGGTPPYSYHWGTTPPQTTASATGIPPGNYSFTVIDGTGCTVTDNFNVVFTSADFYAYLSVDSNPNCGVNNGTITAHANNGLPPYTYHWNNNQTTASAVNLGPGAYWVQVFDAAGCSFSTGSALLPYACYNTITGHIFYDTNSNCVWDSSENSFSGATVFANNGNHTFYGLTDSTGAYSINATDTGTFVVHASFYTNQTCGVMTPCGNSQTVTFNQFLQATANVNFGFTGTNGFDLFMHPDWSWTHPGLDKTYGIYYGNHVSSNPFTGPANLVFQYDSSLVYLSSDAPLPTHNSAAHTLSWALNGVGAWDYRGVCRFYVPTSVLPGSHLQSDYWITPYAGDCDTFSNHVHLSELVFASVDPNGKEVSPAGVIYEDDSVLTYTVHFQNTGTATAMFVTVKDTLSPYLDPLTVTNLASSHQYSQFNISGQGILTWVFNPIYLVDSATSDAESRGFVMFSVKKKKDLPVGTTISNTAHIYFDYNEPVVTNTVVNTLANPVYIFEPKDVNGVSVDVFPNPFSQNTNIVVKGLNEKFDFTLFDVTGRMKKSINSIEDRFEMKRDDLASGVYFYKISTGKRQVAYGKLVVQ